MQFPYLSNQAIAVAAEGLLEKAFGTGPRPPILDLDVVVFDCLCEQEGLVFSDETALGQVDGDQVLGLTRPLQNTILVDRTLKEMGPLGRFRFTVAHEIGHWVLHRPLFLVDSDQRDLFASPEQGSAELVSLHRNVFPDGRGAVPREEWQANRFAVSLLVSPDALREEFQARFGTPPVVAAKGNSAGVRRCALELATKRAGAMPSLADTFGLSGQAMAIYLEDRGYVVESDVFT